MSDKRFPAKTIERKQREAEALKANMKKRKEQAKLLARSTIAPETDKDKPNT